MIRFEPPQEPPEFDEKVRRPGSEWLEQHPNPEGRPPAHWQHCWAELANGFHNLCGYAAMYNPKGTVDHYLSWKNHPELAYEWSNYRYVSAWINSSKGSKDEQVLDPFQIDDDWFEVILPSLQLVITEKVPVHEQARARFTLESLPLRDDERMIRWRQEWYRMYSDGELTLEGLEKKAPLIARAVRKQMAEQGQRGMRES